MLLLLNTLRYRSVLVYTNNPVPKSTGSPPWHRPPLPLPNVPVPFYFTIQPGGSYVNVSGNGPKGAQLIYPSAEHAPAAAAYDCAGGVEICGLSAPKEARSVDRSADLDVDLV